MRKPILLSALAAVTATGGLGTADLRGLKGIVDFLVISQNTAGTNPTMTPQLQSSPPPVAGPVQGTVGAVNNILFSAATTNNKLDAQFTAVGAGLSLQSVQLSLQQLGAVAAGSTVQVDIFADAAGVPTGASLNTSNPVLVSSISTAAYQSVLFTFPKAFDLTAGTVYHIVLSGSYAFSAVNAVQWRSLAVASGGNQSTYNGTTWTAVATQMFEIATFNLAFTNLPANFSVGNPIQQFVQQTGALSVSRQIVSVPVDGPILQGFVRLYATIGGTASPSFNIAAEAIGDGRYNA